MVEKVKIYNKNGSSAEIASIDAREAVKRHPGEWSFNQFPKEGADASTKSKTDTDAKTTQFKS